MATQYLWTCLVATVGLLWGVTVLAHPTDKVEVQVKLIPTNLISLQWNDICRAWNTSEYFGIEVIRVPYNTVWLPDIVLENNIDGKFDVAYYANVLIYSSSYMYWLPPVIYRSTYRDHLLPL